MLENEVAHEVIGAALEVHKALGPGLLESAYQECLEHELELRGVDYHSESSTDFEIFASFASGQYAPGIVCHRHPWRRLRPLR